MRLRTTALLGVLLVLLGTSADMQRGASATRTLPPLLYTCPHHADHLQETPGKCPMKMDGDSICGMELVPVRIEAESWYTCTTHSNVPGVLRPTPGVCPLDRRPLVRVTVTVHWVCSENPEEQLLEPGQCRNGSPRQEVHQVRAHGDHNPKHGGQFFMAEDVWHHVEGTYPRRGLVRVYVYNNMTQPIDVRAMTARLVLREAFDPVSKTTKELEAVPMKPGAELGTLEAALTSDTLPLNVVLKVKFNPTGKEERKDFSFTEYSVGP